MGTERQQPAAKRQKTDTDGSHDNEPSSPKEKDKCQTPLVPTCVENHWWRRDSIELMEYSTEYTIQVKITVGLEKTTFYAYKDRLCRKSDFFQAAYHGAFQESNGTVHLPEQDPTVVEFFIHWVCTGELRGLYNSSLTMTALKSLKLAAEDADRQLQYRPRDPEVIKTWTEKQTALDLANYRDLPLQQLVGLYGFADFAQVKGLKDAIVDAVIEVYSNCTSIYAKRSKPISLWGENQPDCLPDPISLINSAWEKLPADDKLGKVLVNIFVDAISQVSGTRYATELCSAFLAAAFDCSRARQGAVNWLQSERICDYHCHDVPCSRL